MMIVQEKFFQFILFTFPSSRMFLFYIIFCFQALKKQNVSGHFVSTGTNGNHMVIKTNSRGKSWVITVGTIRPKKLKINFLAPARYLTMCHMLFIIFPKLCTW